VHQFGQVSLEDNSSSLLLSRFFPEKASYLIQFDSVPKYRLHYRTSEAQRDRARVSRILRAVAGLNFKALWAVILTFQEADARGKLTKKQREVSLCCLSVRCVVYTYAVARVLHATRGRALPCSCYSRVLLFTGKPHVEIE
jgi:hypothetical protein